jgi:hypothetical protein
MRTGVLQQEVGGSGDSTRRIPAMAVDLDMCKDNYVEMNVWDNAGDKWVMPRNTLAPTCERRAQEFLCVVCRSHLNGDMIEDHVRHPRHISKLKWRVDEMAKINAQPITVAIPPPEDSASIRRFPPPPLARRKKQDPEKFWMPPPPRFPPPPTAPERRRRSRSQKRAQPSNLPELPDVDEMTVVDLEAEGETQSEAHEDPDFVSRLPVSFVPEGALQTRAKSGSPAYLQESRPQWRDFPSTKRSLRALPDRQIDEISEAPPPPSQPSVAMEQSIEIARDTKHVIQLQVPPPAPPPPAMTPQGWNMGGAMPQSLGNMGNMVQSLQQSFPGSCVVIVTPPGNMQQVPFFQGPNMMQMYPMQGPMHQQQPVVMMQPQAPQMGPPWAQQATMQTRVSPQFLPASIPASFSSTYTW